MTVLTDSYCVDSTAPDAEPYHTKLLEHKDGGYELTQATYPGTVCSTHDYVLMTKEQAIDIARIILRNEGITCLA